MQIKYVSFDIADQEFKFYTAVEWHNLIADAKQGIVEQWGEERDYVEAIGLDELLEAYYGDEFFWDELPKSS